MAGQRIWGEIIKSQFVLGSNIFSIHTCWMAEGQEASAWRGLLLNSVIVSCWSEGGARGIVSRPPLRRSPFCPHRLDRFVLLMTPSCYDLIQFARSNWWHTDTLRCRRRGPHGRGPDPIVNTPPRQIRYCY